MTITAAEPSVREILAAGKCSASCILSSLEPGHCRCRCAGAWHGSALAALGLLSQPAAASAPETPGKNRTKRKRYGRRRR